VIRMDKEAVSLQIFPPSDAWKEETLQWMSGLPLALENDETRSEPSTPNPQSSILNPQPSTLIHTVFAFCPCIICGLCQTQA